MNSFDSQTPPLATPRNDDEISDTASAPTTMTMTMTSTTTPIPTFDYMFHDAEDSSEDEVLVPERRDSKFLRFGELRGKERGNWFGGTSMKGSGCFVDDDGVAGRFVEGGADGDGDGGGDAASLNGSMVAVATASEVLTTRPATERTKGIMTVPLSQHLMGMKATPTPSEIGKTKSAGQSLRRVEARTVMPPTPRVTSRWHRAKLWFKGTPKRIRDAFARGEEGEVRWVDTSMTASSGSVDEGDEEARGRSRVSRHEEELSKMRKKATDSLRSVGSEDATDPEKQEEIAQNPHEASVNSDAQTLTTTPNDLSQEHQHISFATRSSPKLSASSLEPKAKRPPLPSKNRSYPDRQRSFRSGTPVGQDSRAKLWPKENQGCGRHRPKMRGAGFWNLGNQGGGRRGLKPRGTWKAKWRGF